MKCPRCGSSDVSSVNNTHYICNNHACRNADGTRTQFMQIMDDSIHFPMNQIYQNHAKNEFYKMQYLYYTTSGVKNIHK